ncbi:Outer membrane receptor for ferrienterochelin and colicins [Candidatus Ornithobacterium hominis]|uniref:TonB-dependent receptor n=1 Tax=Candidatus Ornithobacterium hominis TaxID=2497989 RepID=UPI0024BCAB9D|nr:carboxypeptidase regulatory-like domain-containing protein [Candidatus Ornithobacterium hominis]CAI9429060.1 Outer membrane receptor for ferrienterochelin and colicins [Candidatus Ornithobacterium hominis]
MDFKWKRAYAFALVLGASTSAFSQVTTSDFSGDVIDATHMPIVGAEVKIFHEPTNTVYTAVTNESGSFRINGARSGGPYTITIEQGGNVSFTKSNIFTELGETYNFFAQLESSGINLTEISIVGTRKENNIGSQKTITSEQIRTLPNVNGGIADFVRVAPQVKVYDDNRITIAGQNNRYNAVYLDGAVDNDVFGLSSTGLDGGQVGGNPFTFDELDQISVSVAPMDVRQSGFAGGAINATTKSGKNEMTGSLYWFIRNEKLAGKTASYNDLNRSKLPEFNANRYGASLGGALVENKLFYYFTYEKEKIETPNPYDFSSYRGNSKVADIERLLQVLENKYNYNPGSYGNNTSTMDKDVFVGKLDYNFMQNQSLSFKYKLSNFNSFQAARSGGSLNFIDRTVLFPSKKNQFSLDYNGKWSGNLDAKIALTYKTVKDDRNPNSLFPTVGIQDGNGWINLGADRFSTANKLEQDVLTAIFNLNYKLGNHNLLFGVNYDFYKAMNIFVRDNYGNYIWQNDKNKTGLEKFLAGENASEFSRTFSLLDGGAYGDNQTESAAKFNSSLISAYLQDEWNVDKDFNLTAGVRIDVPTYDNTRENKTFNDEISLFEKAGYDLEGAKTGQKFNAKVHISPRLGFKWTLNRGTDYLTRITGGVGVFTSRMPLVWVGGVYNNTGNTLGQVRERNIAFSPKLDDNHGLQVGSSRPEINLFSKNIKLPQRLKYTLGLDQNLPQGYRLKANAQYDYVLNDVYYENINIKKAGILQNDGRTTWQSEPAISSKFSNVLLGKNINKGYGYTLTVGLDKTFFNKLYLDLNYSYNDTYSINNGASFQNLSQWRYQNTVNGKNVPELYRSDYSAGSRVTALASYSFNWLDIGSKFNTKTKIALFYEGASGQPISYIYNEGSNLILNDISGTSASLIYVPKSIEDINLVDIVDKKTGNVKTTVQQQWDALNAFIENDDYLRTRRGKFAERNASRLPWTNIIDLKVQQEFNVMVAGKKHGLGVSFDIFNFTNLLNKDWGRRYFYNYGTRNIINVNDVKEVSPGVRKAEYTVDPSQLTKERLEAYDNSGISSSLWQMQFGIRYSF